MIIVKLISGLGNQLFQYSLGRQLSLKHNVPLKLDISFFENQSLRTYALDRYNIQGEIATKDELDKMLTLYRSKSLPAKIFRKLERALPKKRRGFYKQDNWWAFEPGVFETGPNLYLEGYWQHHGYFKNFPTVIFNDFKLNEPFDDCCNRLLQGVKENSSSVSIHIRRGDYVSDSTANNLMGVLPLAYYYEAMKLISEKVKDPVYYIFSDSLDWAKENLKMPESSVFVDVQNSSKDFFELELMSSCQHHIIANSSYSWWGAFLNQAPDKIVISPEKWVVPKDLNENIELQLPSWIKL